MFRAFRAMLGDPESKWLAIAAVVVISIGMVFYMLTEHWTPIQALYFCVVTLATVGYGDLHPTTELAQLFTVGYILAGLGIIAGFISELAKHRPMVQRLESSVDQMDGGGPLVPSLRAVSRASEPQDDDTEPVSEPDSR